MRGFKRLNAPEFLIPVWQEYGKKYAERRFGNPKYKFDWYELEGEKLNVKLRPFLEKQTDKHCSYCDCYPLRGRFDHSIDHFRPKSTPKFYEEAFQWENLYIACSCCQGFKLEKYDDLLLRPDEEGYTFGRYFIYDFANHTIDIRDNLSTIDYQKAEITREIFGFNEYDQVESRRVSYDGYFDKPEIPLAKISHRFIFEIGLKAQIK